MVLSRILGQQGPSFAYAGSQDNENLQTEAEYLWILLLLEGASGVHGRSEDGDALEVPETSEGRSSGWYYDAVGRKSDRPGSGRWAAESRCSPDRFGFIRRREEARYNWSYYRILMPWSRNSTRWTPLQRPIPSGWTWCPGKRPLIHQKSGCTPDFWYLTHSQEDFVDSVPGIYPPIMRGQESCFGAGAGGIRL